MEMPAAHVEISFSVNRKNRRTVEYILGRLDARTSPGQCILHLAPGGEIRKIEWREVNNVDEILDDS